MKNYNSLGLKPLYPVPNSRQLEWYSREKMVFFHFGMNTFTNKEWGDGSESPSLFSPSELCVDEWIKTIKECGFTSAILTAKHHDGFCLWQTKYTEHSIKFSPYKNGKGDIVKEFCDACEKYGIKAGIYLSPWDRHEKSWGSDEYNDFYVGQLTELLTSYGKIWEVWWDGAGSTEAVYDWDRWAECVKKHQSDAVIFGSLGATPYVDVRWVGNERGIAGKPCYSTIDKSSLIYEYTDELNHGKIDGDSFIPAEVDVSIRPGWFYHSEQDSEVRTPSNLIDLWFTSNGSNAGLLLNIPPDRRGLIHENDIKSLKEFNRILTSSLSNNLCKGARVNASSERENCPAKNLLQGGIYAPLDSDKECEIVFKLDNPKLFNSFMICEEISLGQRVTGYEFSALINDEWKTLSQGKCIGYRLCERCEPVLSSRVKLKITSALDTPVLKDFGLFYFDYESTDNKAKTRKVTDISISEFCIDANLGGIYPFENITIKNAPKCAYTLYIFDGARFYKHINGFISSDLHNIQLVHKIDYSYRFKIEFENRLEDKSIEIEII
ncbi:MAG: alpha-L-fucosidase [Clostridia bacterium]|nr:alpha-L-fucosidase [Clostridia bacterium]